MASKLEYKIIRTNDDELMHYGVLGMKWGVHRSTGYNQSKEQRRADKALKKDMRDRSRTAANLERQAKYYDSKSSKALSKAIKYDNKITKELEKHPYKSTDKEPRKVAKLSNKLKKATAEHDKLAELKSQANRLPQTPGVYIMKDKKDVIILIKLLL